MSAPLMFAGLALIVLLGFALVAGVWILMQRNRQSLPAFIPTGLPEVSLPGNAQPALPLAAGEITVENASQIAEILKLGKGTMRTISYAPGNDLIALGTDEGVYLYKASTQEQIGLLPVSGEYDLLSLSNDGQWLAVNLIDSIQIWHAGDGTLQTTIADTTYYSTGLVFSLDGQFLASGNQEGVINIWNVKDGSLVKTIPTSDHFSNMVFSPDGQTLAVIIDDANIQLWNVSTAEQVTTINAEGADRIAFAPDGQTLASANYEGVELWQVSDGTLIGSLAATSSASVRDLEFSPDAQILAVSTDNNEIQLWRVTDGLLVTSFWTDDTETIAFFSNGEILVSAASSGSVKFWRVSDVTLIRSIDDHLNSETALVFSPDGKILASGSWDGMIRLWDLTNGNILQTLTGLPNYVDSMVLADAGTSIVAASYEGMIMRWQIGNPEPVSSIQIPQEHYISEVLLAPDGQIAATTDHANFDSVYLWNVNDGSLIKELGVCETNGNSLAFSPDSQLLAVGSYPQVCVLNIQSGEILRSFESQDGIEGLLFSPDGNTLAVNSEHGIDFWNLTNSERITTLDFADADPAVFSPDGQLFVTTEEIWEVQYQNSLRTLDDLQGNIESLAFSPDSRWLAFGVENGAIQIWGVSR
jgi:WD40 repeat protein